MVFWFEIGLRFLLAEPAVDEFTGDTAEASLALSRAAPPALPAAQPDRTTMLLAPRREQRAVWTWPWWETPVGPRLAVPPPELVAAFGIGMPLTGHRRWISSSVMRCAYVTSVVIALPMDSTHSGVMAGNEIDRERARGALAVVKQHPGLALFAVSPAIIAVAVVWAVVGGGWAFLLAIALVLGGGAWLLRKR